MKITRIMIIIIIIIINSIDSIKFTINHNKYKIYINNVIIFNSILTLFPMISISDTYNKDINIDMNRVKLIRQTENFLTNPVLEAIRKIDQLENDESISLESQKSILLYPIVEISIEIDNIKTKLESIKLNNVNDEKIITNTLNEIQNILQSNKYNSKEFKKIFNRYSDNIFYKDPRQANLYLGGGAIPDSSMTTKYLYRNVALTSIEDLKDDINTIIKDNRYNDKIIIDDTIDDINEIIDALDNYIKLCDPNDYKMAYEIYKSSH